jgi:hypothetical protein
VSSSSIGILSGRTVVDPVAIEDVGREIVRWGLIVVLAWIGAMKFTAYEAMGIQPLVAHSPFVSWMYVLSVRSFSAMLGCIENRNRRTAWPAVRRTHRIGSRQRPGDRAVRDHPFFSRPPDGNQLWVSLPCRQRPDSSC